MKKPELSAFQMPSSVEKEKKEEKHIVVVDVVVDMLIVEISLNM